MNGSESARSTGFAPRCSLPRLLMRWQTLWLHWNSAGLGSGQCSKFREMEHQEGTLKLHLFSSCIIYTRLWNKIRYFSLHIHSVQRNYAQTSQGLCWFGQPLKPKRCGSGVFPNVFPFWALLLSTLSLPWFFKIYFFLGGNYFIWKMHLSTNNYRINIWESKGTPPNPTPKAFIGGLSTAMIPMKLWHLTLCLL